MLGDEVRNAVLASVAGVVDAGVALDDISDASELAELGVDSFGLIELGIIAEETAGTTLPDGALEGCRTVGDLIRLVSAMVGND